MGASAPEDKRVAIFLSMTLANAPPQRLEPDSFPPVSARLEAAPFQTEPILMNNPD
jgi:hypothetical protein